MATFSLYQDKHVVIADIFILYDVIFKAKTTMSMAYMWNVNSFLTIRHMTFTVKVKYPSLNNIQA